MALLVIGAGLPNTGTYCLKRALELLGFGRCYHMHELMCHLDHLPYWKELERSGTTAYGYLFEGYSSAVDYPVSRYYKELARQYPDAKVVLTVLNPEEWYNRINHDVYSSRPNSPKARIRMLARLLPSRTGRKVLSLFLFVNKIVWQGLFGGKFTDKARAIAAFKKHAENVRKTIPPSQLLEYNIADGWEPLCAFLGVSVPNIPFPLANSELTERELINNLLQKKQAPV